MRHSTGHRVARRFGWSAAITVAIVGFIAGMMTAAAVALIEAQP